MQLHGTTGVSSSSPYPHGDECGIRRPEPLNTEWTLPLESLQAILRWAGPLQMDLLASSMNHRLLLWVSLFPHPDALGCNCLAIDWNNFMLHGWSHTEHASPHLKLLRLPSAGRPVGSLCTMAAILPPASPIPPILTDDTLPVLRGRPSLPQVGPCGDPCQMDRLPFLRRALLSCQPAEIVDTLLVKYRHSSTRQQQVTWTGRPSNGGYLRPIPRSPEMSSASSISCFLTKGWHLVNYRTALQWPLEEAFKIDFSHPDFSRLATGFFSPPSAHTTNRPSMELVCCHLLLRTSRSRHMFPHAPPQDAVSHSSCNRQSMF